MRYLLSMTMRYLNDPTSENLSQSQLELRQFIGICRDQVFEALSDRHVADFIIKQYHADLYLITQRSDHDYVKSLAEENIIWLLDTYPAFINTQLPVPDDFKKRMLSSFSDTNKDLNDLISTPFGYDQLMILKAGLMKESHEKISLTLSVSQLGVWLHLLYEMNFFSGVNKIDLIRFVAENFSTKRQESISYESLYGKYFKMEGAGIGFIKEQLIQMLNTINKWNRS